jgi:hypothetical protein
MSPLSSDGRKPALSAALRNIAIGLDAYRGLVEQDALYATVECWKYIEDLDNACMRLRSAAEDAIDRQVEARGQ